MHILFFSKNVLLPEMFFAALDRDGSLHKEVEGSQTYLGRIEVPEDQLLRGTFAVMEPGGPLETSLLKLFAQTFEFARLGGSRSI